LDEPSRICGGRERGLGHEFPLRRERGGTSSPATSPAMLKAVVKTLALLAILFVMLYVGMNNTHVIDFQFPIAGTTDKTPIRASAALIYFGVFAVGLVAGTILTVGDGKPGGGRRGGSKDK
jgi:hypothetical protein